MSLTKNHESKSDSLIQVLPKNFERINQNHKLAETFFDQYPKGSFKLPGTIRKHNVT